MSREELVRRYARFLYICEGNCGLCALHAFVEGDILPGPGTSHDINKCPSLGGSEELLRFYAFRRAIKYTPGHRLCWTCHIGAIEELHPDFGRTVHQDRRVGLPMAWGIFQDPELKRDAFWDLVCSSPRARSRGHSWDTVDGFIAWIVDKDATDEPTSVMALMDFVRRKYM